MSSKTKLLTSGSVAARYGRSLRTLMRWIRDRPSGFPAPTQINGRYYWSENDLEAWEHSLASNAALAKKAA
ncbi:helix-turn-helix domain-containing protein [Methylobacterium tarhaniae]|uniref:helix-turn-helix transcriptional regulator n=1 Tax=Methylobacterium tarhaniae TaxID=1187852 RepID=UPI000B12A286